MKTNNAVLKKWERAENYSGEDYSQFYTGPTRHRDSNELDNSNFEAALKELGGESPSVVVAHSGHWAVGWVEQILVHPRAKKKCLILADIKRRLEEYPVLNEDDYSEREADALTEYVSDVYGWMDEAQQAAFIDAIYSLGLEHNDSDGSIYIRNADEASALAHAKISKDE